MWGYFWFQHISNSFKLFSLCSNGGSCLMKNPHYINSRYIFFLLGCKVCLHHLPSERPGDSVFCFSGLIVSSKPKESVHPFQEELRLGFDSYSSGRAASAFGTELPKPVLHECFLPLVVILRCLLRNKSSFPPSKFLSQTIVFSVPLPFPVLCWWTRNWIHQTLRSS